MNRLKWTGLGLAVVATFVVAVVGVEKLVADSVPVVKGQSGRGYWAESIQAVSTVVVMVATTVYAAISYQMVQAMKQQTLTMSASPTRVHVTELSRFLTTFSKPLIDLKHSIAPDYRSPVNRLAEQKDAVASLTAATEQLASFASACPPDIMRRIKPVSDAAFAAMAMVALVQTATIHAAQSAMKEDVTLLEDLFRRIDNREDGSAASAPSASSAFDPSWDEVRAEYLLHVRDGATGKPEWDYMVSGKWIDDVYVVWGELITACTSFLLQT